MTPLDGVRAGILAGCLALASGALAEASKDHDRPRGVDLATLGQLTTHRGSQFETTVLRGRPTILFFGYTHCPEVCPTTLMEVSQFLNDLGEQADRINVIFVTVDPARDTVEELAPYLANFDRRIVGLTGSVRNVDAAVTAFGASRLESATGGAYYSVNHTASTFLIDRYGLLAGIVDYGDTNALAQTAARLLAQ